MSEQPYEIVFKPDINHARQLTWNDECVSEENMGRKTLKLEEVINVLRRRKAAFKKDFGVSAIGVFGSVAKGKARSGGDMDVVVKMIKPDLFFLVHIKEELENDYQTKVDIVHYRDKMNTFLKKRIGSEAVYV